jgi:hypothetical protein
MNDAVIASIGRIWLPASVYAQEAGITRTTRRGHAAVGWQRDAAGDPA